MQIIVSNGSYKFHLAALANELGKCGHLAQFITAGYPNRFFRGLAKLLPGIASLARLIDRGEEIPAEKVAAYNSVELLFKSGDILFRNNRYFRELFHVLAYKIYAVKASSYIRRSVADIYHYRNCYGRASVAAAKRRGMLTVCDHSIAHPAAIGWMVNNRGAMPPKETQDVLISSLLPHERAMFNDLYHDDYIVVNSEFVKKTLMHFGIDESRIEVVYLGVDDQFMNFLDLTSPRVYESRCNLLYAGGWQQRKGVGDLAQALEGADFEWELDIAGGHEFGIDKVPLMQCFLSRRNVTVKGALPRKQLAELMRRHRIFVFPSYCEGSARVVFEAMAAGLYIITTANAGSIVEDGVHGTLVPPGEPHMIRNAILYAFDRPELVARIGDQNRQLISGSYRQFHYGKNMLSFYSRVLAA